MTKHLHRHRLLVALGAGLLFCAALVAGTASGAAASVQTRAASYQDWPTFLQNTSRTAATTDPVLSLAKAPDLTVKWAYQTGGPMATSASIVGTTAYVGSWDGYEYAIDTTTGTLIWKTFLGQTTDPACNPNVIGITSSAAVVGGVVYVGGGGLNWYALNAATGAVEWHVYTGLNTQAGAHYNWSSPLIVGNYAYIGIASNCDAPLVRGELMKVAISGAQQGQVVATHYFVPAGQIGGGVWTSPTYDAATNTIFVSTGTINDYTQTQSDALVAVDATTLATKSVWQLPFEVSVSDSDWGTTPTLTTNSSGDPLMSVANKNGVLYTFHRNDIAAGPIWQHRVAIGGDCPPCGDGTIASGVFAKGVLYYAGGSNFSNGSGSSGSITAFNPGTGKVLWSRQTEGAILGSPAYVNGMIAEAEGSTFEVLNAATGALLYSYQLPAPVYGAVSVARGKFFVNAQNGVLYAFGPRTVVTTPPPDPNCPQGFTCQDIGNPGLAGKESTSGGVLSVTGSGYQSATADKGRLVSQPVTGDFQASTEIVSQTPAPPAGPRPNGGLMVRQSTVSGSPEYAVLEGPSGPTDGGGAPRLIIWYWSGFGAPRIEATRALGVGPPVYVMIQRRGNLFSTGFSTDGGVHYQLMPGSTVDLDLPATTQTGLYVNSGSATVTNTTSFSNTAIGGLTTTMAPQPTVHPCPATWTCTDIGNPSPRGDTTSTSATALTLDGTGTGITLGPTDALHYVYRPVSGNQTLSAQVVTTATNPPGAQEGIMMRASTSPASPYYAVLLNPGGSATVQWRSYDGVPNRSAHLALPSVTSPAYVRIVRWQDNNISPARTFFSALTSTDGTTWTPVLGSTAPIDMGTSYLSGLAATSTAPRVTPAVSYDAVAMTAASSQPPGLCPGGFSCNDVGVDILPGNQVYLSPSQSGTPAGTWAIQAGGSDIWSVYDNFRFISQPFPQDPANSRNGDGTVSARIVSQGGTSPAPWMKTGVMIRSSATDPQAPYYGVFLTPQHGVLVQWRPTEAAQTGQVSGSPAAATPIWVMVSRYTDTTRHTVLYSAYTSADGKTWTYVPGSTVRLSLPGKLVAGIAADSYQQTLTAPSVVDDLASLPGANAPPFICPTAWSCADIGGALPPGQDQLTSRGIWNESAGGGDIWAKADSFHFDWRQLAGDGTISARVTAQQAVSPWSKAGVMIRASIRAGSPYYAAMITPGYGIDVQWRTKLGGTTNQVLTPGTVPVYLMVARYITSGSRPKTYYTAYTSANGKTWTAVPGSSVPIPMTGRLLAGIAMTSHAQGTAGSVTLAGVKLASVKLPPPA